MRRSQISITMAVAQVSKHGLIHMNSERLRLHHHITWCRLCLDVFLSRTHPPLPVCVGGDRLQLPRFLSSGKPREDEWMNNCLSRQVLPHHLHLGALLCFQRRRRRDSPDNLAYVLDLFLFTKRSSGSSKQSCLSELSVSLQCQWHVVNLSRTVFQ